MMAWSRAGRLCAAAVDLTLRSPGSCLLLLRLKANRVGHVTETLRKGHTVHWSRRPLCGAAPLTHAHLRTHRADPQSLRARGLVNTDWEHWERVAAVAVGLSKGYSSEGGSLGRVEPPRERTERRHHDTEQPPARAVFSAPWGVSRRTMSTFARASSTATAAKRSDPGEEAGAEERDKKQNMKEAPGDPSSSERAPGEPEPEGEKPSRAQQLKNVFKEYGAVGVCFHISISLMSLGMFYLLISSGIDMAAVLCKLGFSESLVQSKMAAGTSTFVLAYAVHKLFAPARISITLVSVPLIVRYFRKTGLFKPPTPTP